MDFTRGKTQHDTNKSSSELSSDGDDKADNATDSPPKMQHKTRGKVVKTRRQEANDLEVLFYAFYLPS